MSDELRERCKQLYQRLGRDRMLRQGDPVETIKAFVENEIAPQDDSVIYSQKFAEGMTKAVSRVEALLEGMAKSGIYVLDKDEAVAVLRRALDRAERHEAGVLETLTLQGIVLARRGS